MALNPTEQFEEVSGDTPALGDDCRRLIYNYETGKSVPACSGSCEIWGRVALLPEEYLEVLRRFGDEARPEWSETEGCLFLSILNEYEVLGTEKPSSWGLGFELNRTGWFWVARIPLLDRVEAKRTYAREDVRTLTFRCPKCRDAGYRPQYVGGRYQPVRCKYGGCAAGKAWTPPPAP